jgi:DNA-binding transcriptional LysR family regulator
LNIKIDASNVLARDLLASRLDFIIGRVPDDLDARLFDSLAIGLEEANLIVRRGHPLLARAPVDVESLAAFEWVMQPRGTPLRRSIDALFVAHNVPAPERFSNTTSLLLTMILVAQSDAIAPISIEAAKFAAGGGTAGAIEILPTQFSIVVQPYSLIAMRNRLLSPAAQGVYSIIREEAAMRERRALAQSDRDAAV